MIGAAPRSPRGFPFRAIATLGLALACGPSGRTTPASPARDGISIALYASRDGDGFGVIDDRRWIDLAGDSLVIDHIDPGAVVSSFVIEPLAGGALAIGACLRERLAVPPAPGAGAPDHGQAMSAAAIEWIAPALRCTVHARHGRYLVRVRYVAPALRYRVQHDIAMTAPDHATITSRFAIATPAWRARAELTLFDGIPGGEQPPREVARGTIVLDGGTAVLAAPPRDVSAQLRRIYNGAVVTDTDNPLASQPAVWVWLELAEPALVPGPVRVHVEYPGEPARDIDVPAAGHRHAAATLRLPLWIDDQLRGIRDRKHGSPGDAIVTDRYTVSVANLGAATREVWIEETLAPARRQTVVRAWPSEPTLVKNRLRMKLTVHGGKLERGRFEIASEP